MLASAEFEPPRTVDSPESKKRPFDAKWSKHPGTFLEGFDLTYGNPSAPSYGSISEVTGLTPAARTAGHVVNRLETSKNKKLKITRLVGRNDKAHSCVRALGAEATTGGLGKSGQEVMKELAKIRHPGDNKDPLTRIMRAVWRTRTLRAHTFALLRFRYDVARRKLRRIQFGLIETHGSGILAPQSQDDLWAWDHAQFRSNRIPPSYRSFKPRGA